MSIVRLILSMIRVGLLEVSWGVGASFGACLVATAAAPVAVSLMDHLLIGKPHKPTRGDRLSDATLRYVAAEILDHVPDRTRAYLDEGHQGPLAEMFPAPSVAGQKGLGHAEHLSRFMARQKLLGAGRGYSWE